MRGLKERTVNKQMLVKAPTYLSQLLPQMEPHRIEGTGPMLAIQQKGVEPLQLVQRSIAIKNWLMKPARALMKVELLHASCFPSSTILVALNHPH